VRSETIALNYAEALFALAKRGTEYEHYADLIDAVASAVEQSERIQAVMMSPRVPKAAKAALLGEALKGSAPRDFVLFLQAVVKRGRQALFREIATAYLGLVDVQFNRVRATVTLAREPNTALMKSIQEALERMLEKDVITQYRTEPALLGGAVVRVGDRIYDGSVKRRMAVLRRKLLSR